MNICDSSLVEFFSSCAAQPDQLFLDVSIVLRCGMRMV